MVDANTMRNMSNPDFVRQLIKRNEEVLKIVKAFRKHIKKEGKIKKNVKKSKAELVYQLPAQGQRLFQDLQEVDPVLAEQIRQEKTVAAIIQKIDARLKDHEAQLQLTQRLKELLKNEKRTRSSGGRLAANMLRKLSDVKKSEVQKIGKVNQLLALRSALEPYSKKDSYSDLDMKFIAQTVRSIGKLWKEISDIEDNITKMNIALTGMVTKAEILLARFAQESEAIEEGRKRYGTNK